MRWCTISLWLLLPQEPGIRFLDPEQYYPTLLPMVPAGEEGMIADEDEMTAPPDLVAEAPTRINAAMEMGLLDELEDDRLLLFQLPNTLPVRNPKVCRSRIPVCNSTHRDYEVGLVPLPSRRLPHLSAFAALPLRICLISTMGWSDAPPSPCRLGRQSLGATSCLGGTPCQSHCASSSHLSLPASWGSSLSSRAARSRCRLATSFWMCSLAFLVFSAR